LHNNVFVAILVIFFWPWDSRNFWTQGNYGEFFLPLVNLLLNFSTNCAQSLTINLVPRASCLSAIFIFIFLWRLLRLSPHQKYQKS